MVENAIIGRESGMGTGVFREILIGPGLDMSDTLKSTTLNGYMTAQVDAVTTTTLVDLTDLSITIIAGIYRIACDLYIDASTVGGVKIDMAGTATYTDVIIEVAGFSTAKLFLAEHFTALGGGGVGGLPGEVNSFVRIFGFIICDGAGTIVPRFAQNVADGTSSVLKLSNIRVEKI